jgi:phosphohistidine phosphatase
MCRHAVARMLTLSLFRHAKSSWADPSLEDSDRPLAPRGLKAAPMMGAFMAEQPHPDLVLCSPARRTRDTLALVADLIGKPRTFFPASLYLATPETLLASIGAAKEPVRHLMLVGHNPGLHVLATALIGPDESAAAKSLSAKFPTAGLAVITFQVETWRDIVPGAGQLSLFMTPKRLS